MESVMTNKNLLQQNEQAVRKMSMLERIEAPTPSFFKKIRKIGLILTAISGALLAAPITLPSVLTTIAAYLGVAGTVATAISQTATEDESVSKKEM